MTLTQDNLQAGDLHSQDGRYSRTPGCPGRTRSQGHHQAPHILGTKPRSVVSTGRSAVHPPEHHDVGNQKLLRCEFAGHRDLCAHGTSVAQSPHALLLHRTETTLTGHLRPLRGQATRAFNNITKLGDRKPSEVMDQMLLLHGREPPTFLLRYAFKKLLPPPVRHTLSAFPSDKPRTWAKEADRLMVNHEEHTARAPSPAHSLPPPLTEVYPVLAIATPHRPVRRLPPLPRQSSRQERLHEVDYCYFHRCFDTTASNCRAPCSWAGNEAASSG